GVEEEVGGLGHGDADEVAVRIVEPDGAVTAVPAVPAGDGRQLVRFGGDRHAVPPALGFQQHARGGDLLRGQVVGGQHGDRLRRQQPAAVVRATVEQQSGEGEEVVGGRQQAAGAGREHRRGGPFGGRRRRLQFHLTGGEIGHVVARDPFRVRRGGPETGVDHAERVVQQGFQHVVYRRAGGPGEQDAEDQRAGVVLPALAGLVHQRQGGE